MLQSRWLPAMLCTLAALAGCAGFPGGMEPLSVTLADIRPTQIGLFEQEYAMKLRVQNRPDGTTLVQGKVWHVGGAEPAAWTIQKTDRIPHRNGAPGLYGDGISDVFFDNMRAYKNQ